MLKLLLKSTTYMSKSWSVMASVNCSLVGGLPTIPFQPFSLKYNGLFLQKSNLLFSPATVNHIYLADIFIWRLELDERSEETQEQGCQIKNLK